MLGTQTQSVAGFAQCPFIRPLSPELTNSLRLLRSASSSLLTRHVQTVLHPPKCRDFSFTWAPQPYSFSPSLLQRELLLFCTHLFTFCARALPLVTLPQIGTSQAPKVCAAERRSRVRTCRILSSPRDGSLRRVPSVDRCVRGYTREALSSAFGSALSQVQALDGRVSDGVGQSLSSSCVGRFERVRGADGYGRG